jgi:hypothetical protein
MSEEGMVGGAVVPRLDGQGDEQAYQTAIRTGEQARAGPNGVLFLTGEAALPDWAGTPTFLLS